MAFNGKLVELKTSGSYVNFPLKYIKAESYKVTPDQRMEQSVQRSVTGVLVRATVSHTPSKIVFETSILKNADVKAIQTLFSNAYTNALQRKLDIRYYNPATDSYKTGTFYVPDVDYDILRIEKNTNVIWYNSIQYTLIEY